MIFKQDLK